MNKQPIAVLGAGSWGTALAISLARNGNHVHLWGRDSTRMQLMAKRRCNPTYLPDIHFPDSLSVFNKLSDTLQDIPDILLVVPSHAFSQILQQIKPFLNEKVRIAWSIKGFVDGKLLHQVANEVLGNHIITATISGPSFAREVAQGLPTAVTIASHDTLFLNETIKRLAGTTFRAYPSTDMVGVAVAGAVKNTLAIAAGITEGLQLGANAQAALITRGLAEITRLGLAMGGQQETFMGLAGMGDVVLTCSDNQSRNRRFGLLLGQGKTMNEATEQINSVIEGINTTREVYQLAQKYDIDMPIVEQVYLVLKGKTTPQHAARALLTRNLKII